MFGVNKKPRWPAEQQGRKGGVTVYVKVCILHTAHSRRQWPLPVSHTLQNFPGV